MTETPQVIPESTATALCAAVLAYAEPPPETRRVDVLALDLGGVPGSRHHGFVRGAGPREPWYPRGMPMRSGRQLTIISVEELALIAAGMRVERLEPEWIGANIVLEGLRRVSWLPPGTRLIFDDATIVVEAQNAPCRVSGKSIARHLDPDGRNPALPLEFPKHAVGLRGLVASVERAGSIRAGEPIRLKVPKQSIWSA